ncbi:hypothetical protein [Ramlibacter sp. Leaf400]|uniref:hypothetical protein n=1 Tax=Ramlibacter sp. Leaf400 TaxID=1736365 RepID=UPI00070071E0|nr:hypothetical protein [Ramlibacter sp. Leaf400]
MNTTSQKPILFVSIAVNSAILRRSGKPVFWARVKYIGFSKVIHYTNAYPTPFEPIRAAYAWADSVNARVVMLEWFAIRPVDFALPDGSGLIGWLQLLNQ